MIYNISNGPFFGNEVARADAKNLEEFKENGIVLFWKAPVDVQGYRKIAKAFHNNVRFGEFNLGDSDNRAVATSHEMMIDAQFKGWGAAAIRFRGGVKTHMTTESDVVGLLDGLHLDIRGTRIKGVSRAEQIGLGEEEYLIHKKNLVFIFVWGTTENCIEPKREFIRFAEEHEKHFSCVLIEDVPTRGMSGFFSKHRIATCPAILCFKEGRDVGSRDDLNVKSLKEYLDRQTPRKYKGVLRSLVSIVFDR